MNQLETYWQNLKPNEQLLLKCAAVIFTLFIIVMLIIRPLNNKIEKAEKTLQQQQELAQFVKQSAAKINGSGQGKRAVSGSLSQIINVSSRRAQISISKMQPKDETLRLTIESVEFNKLLIWLESLVEDSGLTISAIDINRGAEPGMVSISRLVVEK
ncbi:MULTISPECIES: type II secretion system protein GspM [Pseudoalteromonas]|uniref:type II secretion system protein GspM n=1 Tax=Pseudoalteromonas TaxID=53246 RepID=UPI000CF7015F|nr:type II secretion system protein M [Pseudoalteromonas sp. T1lg24]